MQGDFRINDWLVQPQINSVERDGKTWHLEPKVMQVLVQLASHPNEVLSKDRLLEAVWHDTFVGDDVLIRCISEIRYVFGDEPRSSRVVQTIPKGGYRPIATVTTGIPPDADAAPSIAEKIVLTPNPHVDHDSGHEREGHALPASSGHAVVPHGARNSDDSAETEHAVATVEVAHRSEDVVVQNPTASRPRFWAIAAGALLFVLLAGLGATYAWKFMHHSAVDFFWGPVLNTSDPVLFCIADQNQYVEVALRDAADPAHQILLKDNLTAVVIDDLNAVVQITGILKSNEKKYSLKGEGATTLTDLRNGPTIFVGAFDNAWTLRLTNSLRYHFANNPDMSQFRIVDSRSPSQTSWVVNRSQQMATNNYRDYAIVARFTDSNTGKLAVIVAGVSRGGTIAAGEFVTDSSDLAQLASAARAAGNKKNMEIVLSTPIIDGEPGPPKMEAAYFW